MKRVLGLGLILASAVVLLSGCNCYNRMSKKANSIQTKCTPEVLTLKGSTVTADVTVTFPPKFFDEMAILKITPVLVFDGGEIAGTPKFVQGEKVRDNFTVISWKEGGSYTQTVSFPYDKRADVSTLVLRFDAKCSEACSKKFNDYLPLDGKNAKGIAVARGISHLQDLVGVSAYKVAYIKDNYKGKTETRNVNILFDINKSNVTTKHLDDAQKSLNDLEQFVVDNTAKDGVNMGNVAFKGYASPDGPAERINQPLSDARGKNAKAAYVKQFGDTKSDVGAFGLGEDWEGFQKEVQDSKGLSDSDKKLILQVIDMQKNPDEREKQIKNLAAAWPTLVTEVLPKLRRAVISTSADTPGLEAADLIAATKSNPASLTDVEAWLKAGAAATDNAEKVRIYSYAAEKFNNAAAYNNLGAALVESGKYAEAQKALDKANSLKAEPAAVTNNLGVLDFAQGKVAEAKKKFASLPGNMPEATFNKGLIAINEGNYADAEKNLKSGVAAAQAAVLNGDLSKASQLLANDKSADGYYLKAVIAARQNNANDAISNLKNAIGKDASLKERAKTDIEFVKLFENPAFKAL